ncbi:chorion class high cysteine protein 12 [Echinococcus multilocularis]|uniref:Chorion class high cysteine protein 12 n=1 Tax=Echinococcus multilocularis TaxID=6211 RepID=A0A0S4MKR1_ECHMU|nr:chorion class high cysteine protein 12 [Echinococcus multilocularis]
MQRRASKVLSTVVATAVTLFPGDELGSEQTEIAFTDKVSKVPNLDKATSLSDLDEFAHSQPSTAAPQMNPSLVPEMQTQASKVLSTVVATAVTLFPGDELGSEQTEIAFTDKVSKVPNLDKATSLSDLDEFAHSQPSTAAPQMNPSLVPEMQTQASKVLSTVVATAVTLFPGDELGSEQTEIAFTHKVSKMPNMEKATSLGDLDEYAHSQPSTVAPQTNPSLVPEMQTQASKVLSTVVATAVTLFPGDELGSEQTEIAFTDKVSKVPNLDKATSLSDLDEFAHSQPSTAAPQMNPSLVPEMQTQASKVLSTVVATAVTLFPGDELGSEQTEIAFTDKVSKVPNLDKATSLSDLDEFAHSQPSTAAPQMNPSLVPEMQTQASKVLSTVVATAVTLFPGDELGSEQTEIAFTDKVSKVPNLDKATSLSDLDEFAHSQPSTAAPQMNPSLVPEMQTQASKVLSTVVATAVTLFPGDELGSEQTEIAFTDKVSKVPNLDKATSLSDLDEFAHSQPSTAAPQMNPSLVPEMQTQASKVLSTVVATAVTLFPGDELGSEQTEIAFTDKVSKVPNLDKATSLSDLDEFAHSQPSTAAPQMNPSLVPEMQTQASKVLSTVVATAVTLFPGDELGSEQTEIAFTHKVSKMPNMEKATSLGDLDEYAHSQPSTVAPQTNPSLVPEMQTQASKVLSTVVATAVTLFPGDELGSEQTEIAFTDKVSKVPNLDKATSLSDLDEFAHSQPSTAAPQMNPSLVPEMQTQASKVLSTVVATAVTLFPGDELGSEQTEIAFTHKVSKMPNMEKATSLGDLDEYAHSQPSTVAPQTNPSLVPEMQTQASKVLSTVVATAVTLFPGDELGSEQTEIAFTDKVSKMPNMEKATSLGDLDEYAHSQPSTAAPQTNPSLVPEMQTQASKVLSTVVATAVTLFPGDELGSEQTEIAFTDKVSKVPNLDKATSLSDLDEFAHSQPSTAAPQMNPSLVPEMQTQASKVLSTVVATAVTLFPGDELGSEQTEIAFTDKVSKVPNLDKATSLSDLDEFAHSQPSTAAPQMNPSLVPEMQTQASKVLSTVVATAVTLFPGDELGSEQTEIAFTDKVSKCLTWIKRLH